MIITIEPYGIFRDFFAKPIEFSFDKPISIGAIKSQIETQIPPQFHSKNLVETSVIADDKQILPNDYIINTSQNLMILPPVSGGL